MKTFDDIILGEKAQFTKTIGEPEVHQFSEITEDRNPIHLDEDYARSTIFKKRIAQGMLVSGLISNVLANKLPGPGTIYLFQSLNFLAPVYLGDRITAEVEVTEKIPGKYHLVLKTTCTNQEGKRVIDGEARVMYKK